LRCSRPAVSGREGAATQRRGYNYFERRDSTPPLHDQPAHDIVQTIDRLEKFAL
jgi:hypothetical protein